jgi:hypothetical protein
MKAVSVAVVGCILLGLAASAPALGPGAGTEWADFTDERTVTVTTENEDGSPRETTIWLVVMDGQGYIRTANTRWGRNVDRNPDVILRIETREYPLRAVRVADDALFQRVMTHFREKYGLQDRLTGLFRTLSGNIRIMHLVPRPEDPHRAEVE